MMSPQAPGETALATQVGGTRYASLQKLAQPAFRERAVGSPQTHERQFNTPYF